MHRLLEEFCIKSKHKCKDEYNVKKVSQPQFDNVDLHLMGYLCDLCNYVRLEKEGIQKHLKFEHEEDSDRYKDVIFLSFCKNPRILT